MLKRSLLRIAIQAAAMGATIALAACSAQSYPEPSEAPPPPPPPSELMGAPSPPPSEVPPLEAAPPEVQPLDVPPPEAQTYQPPSPVIIAMAPIPNPPEPARPSRGIRRGEGAYAAPEAAPAPARSTYRDETVPPPPVAKAPRPAHNAARAAPPKLAPKHSVTKVVPPAKLTKPSPAPKLGAAPALKTPAPPAAKSTTPLGDRATRLAALEMSLAEAVANGARLTVPKLTANRPADVTLTLPAGFAQTVRDEAIKNELSDAAAAVNITSLLSGDGFTISPNVTQSQPLVPGAPTEFHWSVTAAEPDAKNLRASLGADLIGAGSDILNLGSVTASSGGFKLTPRILGAGILILIAAAVVAALTQGRSALSRSAIARRNARRSREPAWRNPNP